MIQSIRNLQRNVCSLKEVDLNCFVEWSDGKCHDLKICELLNDTTSGDISEFIYTVTGEFLADSKDSNEISNEIARTMNIGDFVSL